MLRDTLYRKFNIKTVYKAPQKKRVSKRHVFFMEVLCRNRSV